MHELEIKISVSFTVVFDTYLFKICALLKKYPTFHFANKS